MSCVEFALKRGARTDGLLDVTELVQKNVVPRSWLDFYHHAPVNCLAMALDGYEVALNIFPFSKSIGDSNECLWGLSFRIRADILDPKQKAACQKLCNDCIRSHVMGTSYCTQEF